MPLVFNHHFSLDEAQQLVPWVEEQLVRLLQLRMTLRRSVTEPTEVTGHLCPQSFPRELFELFGLMRTFEERGVLLRDPIAGVADLPHLLPSGEEVVLCYLRGDGVLRFYHGPGGSFGERRPLQR